MWVFVRNDLLGQLQDGLLYFRWRRAHSGVLTRDGSIGCDCPKRRVLRVLIVEDHSTLFLFAGGESARVGRELVCRSVVLVSIDRRLRLRELVLQEGRFGKARELSFSKLVVAALGLA